MAVSGWGSDYGDIARTRPSGAAWWLLSFDPHTDTSAMRHNRPGVAVDDEPPPGVPMEHRRSWSTTLNNKRAGLLSLLGRAGWNRRTTTGITRRQCEVVTVLQSRVYACRPRPAGDRSGSPASHGVGSFSTHRPAPPGRSDCTGAARIPDRTTTQGVRGGGCSRAARRPVSSDTRPWD